MINREFPHLFQPVKIRGALYRSRLLSAPNMLSQVDKGIPNSYYVDYLENKAMGGAAEVVISEMPVNSRGAHHKAIPLDEDGATLIGQMIGAIQQHGALACAELTHAGRLAPPVYIGGQQPWGPIAETLPDGTEVLEMNEEMMDEVANDFARAAVYFKNLGCDVVMVHAGHNWLLSQFLSPHTNKRTDKYGGTPENRMRFPLMVLKKVREAVGPNFPVEMRVSGSDRDDDNSGKPVEETIALLKAAEDYVDLVNVSAGMLDTSAQYAVQATFLPHNTNVCLAEAIKKAGVKQYVVAVGSISNPHDAEEIIASGKADFVAMARAIIADPQFPNKARTGKAYDIRPCLRCSECQDSDETKMLMTCSVNPTIGREGRAFYRNKAEKQLKIVIVGGGPAGMQAAITSAERGHETILIEKSDRLGGLLNFTDYDSVKDDLRLFKNYLVDKVGRSNVNVMLNTEATPDMVEAMRADAILVATGSERIVPRIDGIENAVHALDIYKPDAEVGEEAVIIGGGLVGCELALHLGREGKKVTVVEMTSHYGGQCAPMYRMGMDYYLKKYGINFMLETACLSVEKDGVTVRTADGETKKVKADNVIYCVGMKSVDKPFFDMFNSAETVISIGDCRRVGKVGNAVQDGYNSVIDLA